MSFTPRSLDPAVWVAAQIAPEAMQELAAAGFTVVVSHRPDDEEPGQPNAGAMAAAAASQGLRFIHAPVQGFPDQVAVGATAQVLSDLAPDDRVLMFCRSGTRSTVAWALAMRALNRAEPDDLRQAAANAGHDLSRLPL